MLIDTGGLDRRFVCQSVSLKLRCMQSILCRIYDGMPVEVHRYLCIYSDDSRGAKETSADDGQTRRRDFYIRKYNETSMDRLTSFGFLENKRERRGIAIDE